jgi:hypothetical protein
MPYGIQAMTKKDKPSFRRRPESTLKKKRMDAVLRRHDEKVKGLTTEDAENTEKE